MTRTTQQRQWPPGAPPYYRPCLIVAVAAGVGIVTGSFGPWLSAPVSSLNGVGIGPWGVTTVICGVIAAAGAAMVCCWGLTRWHPRWTIPLLWAVAVAAVWSLAVSVSILIRIRSLPATYIFDVAIEVDIGWGVWLLACCAAVLCLVVSTGAIHYGKIIGRRSLSGRSWVRRWRIAALVAALIMAVTGSLYGTTGWNYRSYGDPMPRLPSSVNAPR